MEPPKEDIVIDFMAFVERFKEKIKTQTSALKELQTEDDFEKFKAGVIFAIEKIVENMVSILTIIDLQKKMAGRQMQLSDAFYVHSHEGGLLKLPEGFFGSWKDLTEMGE